MHAASADVNVTFTLPTSTTSAAVELFGVSVLSGAALYGGDPNDSGVDALVNVSAAKADGTRVGFMTISRRHGSCFYEGCCDPCPPHNKPQPPAGCGVKGGRGGGNCTVSPHLLDVFTCLHITMPRAVHGVCRAAHATVLSLIC